MTDQLHDGRRLPIFIHSHVDDMTDLTPNAMRVYMHLARRAGKGEAWPSYQSIGDHCFSSVYKNADVRKRHAINAVKELVAAKLIGKQERIEPGGQQTNLYTLLDTTVPAVTPQSPPEVLRSHPPSDSTVTPGVTPQSPKGSPIEVNSIEDTPREEGMSADADARPPTEWQEFVGNLCWVCYGHKKVQSLTDAKRGQLTAEAKKIRDLGYGTDELRTWYRDVWQTDWRYQKNKQRPVPADVRSSIASVEDPAPAGFDVACVRQSAGAEAVDRVFARLAAEGVILNG